MAFCSLISQAPILLSQLLTAFLAFHKYGASHYRKAPCLPSCAQPLVILQTSPGASATISNPANARPPLVN
ncbi:hypothetical protein C8Q77DRAFT_1137879 [Trametes polyzona]|nr:hypothetical protein C8Q77DRAFT_1137879 [Trametes polyzona]